LVAAYNTIDRQLDTDKRSELNEELAACQVIQAAR
jgi:hypothetical protein